MYCKKIFSQLSKKPKDILKYGSYEQDSAVKSARFEEIVDILFRVWVSPKKILVKDLSAN